MQRFTQAIEDSLSSKNWNSALFLALSLPDICCRLNSVSGKKAYAGWFEKYLGHIYTHEGDVFLSGDDCFSLRCALLHQGVADLRDHGKGSVISKFHFTVASCHICRIQDVLQLDVRQFCRDMVSGVHVWLVSFKEDDPLFDAKLKTLLFVHVGDSNVNGVIIGGEDPLPPFVGEVQSSLNEMYVGGSCELDMQNYLLSTGYDKNYAEEKFRKYIDSFGISRWGRDMQGRRMSSLSKIK